MSTATATTVAKVVVGANIVWSSVTSTTRRMEKKGHRVVNENAVTSVQTVIMVIAKRKQEAPHATATLQRSVFANTANQTGQWAGARIIALLAALEVRNVAMMKRYQSEAVDGHPLKICVNTHRKQWRENVEKNLATILMNYQNAEDHVRILYKSSRQGPVLILPIYHQVLR